MKRFVYVSHKQMIPKVVRQVAGLREAKVRCLSYNKTAEFIEGNNAADLILLDCRDNLEEVKSLCSGLKEKVSYSKIPVIVLLEADFASKRIEVIQAGADEYVFKPLHKIELAAKVAAFERIKHTYDELERKNRELTELSSNYQELIKLKNDLVSMISHDLKVPVANISSFASLLTSERLGTLNNKQKQLLNTILKNGDNMLQLVDSLLDFFEVYGELTLRKQSLDVYKVLHNIYHRSRHWAQTKEQDLVFNVPEDLGTLFTDKLRFVQAVENVLHNAFKYTPRGGRIEIGADCEAQTGKKLVFYIRDNGMGIPPSHAKKIFQQFCKNHHFGTEGEFGLGLGLAVSEKIIHKMHGTITVDSKPQCETTFHLSFKKTVKK